MNNEDAAFKYEKVYLFVTYRINEDPRDRFWKARSKDWNFFVCEKDVYFNENKLRLFIDFWDSQADKSLKQTFNEAFEVKDIQQKITLDKLIRYESEGTLDLPKKWEEAKKMLSGVVYSEIKSCFKSFVDIKYDEYVANDDTFKKWKELYYIDDKEHGVIVCALNDYDRENYKEEFIDYIYCKLPLLFPANKYYIFIHGRYLIADNNETYIETKEVGAMKFYIKTFHHIPSYLEYKFLISQERFNYLYLELLVDSIDNKKVVELLKEVDICIISILDDPEFVDDKDINELVGKLTSIKSNEKMVDDTIFALIEQIRYIHKGPELVNLLNNIVAKSQLLGIK